MSIQLNEKVLLEGYACTNPEERINAGNQPYASFSMIVHQKNFKTGFESKNLYHVCVKGQMYEYIMGKKNPQNKLQVGDGVLVYGDYRPSINSSLLLAHLDSATASLKEGNIPAALSSHSELKTIIEKGYSLGKSPRPLLYRNVFVTGYGDWIMVFSRRSRTLLHDELISSGVRQLYSSLSDNQFNSLVVKILRSAAEQAGGKILPTSEIGNVKNAALLIEQSMTEESEPSYLEMALAAEGNYEPCFSEGFDTDTLPI